ncbi:hypothetical protein CK203_048364 [Vitis vinifera]|uniref:Uncharacterized protein n=1 Tax=Vitis vinifera TaxID=29760 RepID=A0A438HRF2_VITVI|nr:hypothetical protein CK203_048364 [Vitis vinifera]
MKATERKGGVKRKSMRNMRSMKDVRSGILGMTMTGGSARKDKRRHDSE